MGSAATRGSRASGAEALDELGEARLVEGLRRGSPDAFAVLHRHYAGGIYNVALHLVRRGEDAEDITHDVLIRAFERVPRQREVMLRPWLYRLTVNRCYDHFRAAKRRAVIGADHRDDAVAPDDPFERAAQGRLFEAALGGLTRRQRLALLLKDVHGLSLVEVAATLDLTPGSAEVLLARSRNAFRSRYRELCRAEGLPAPSATAALAALSALPHVPLPPGLHLPPPVPAPLPPIAAPLLPLGGALGGIGSAIGAAQVAKLAAVVLAAATAISVGSAVEKRVEAHRPMPHVAAAAARTVTGAVGVGGSARGATPSPAARGAAPSASPTHTPMASTSPTADPSPSPSASAGDGSASPTPSPTPTGPYAEPSVTPTPTASPTPTATPTPTPTDSPTPTATPSASPTASH
jgi:RNA polymerase sigma factor (sigma-70 family)